jgi:hypothetical protein
LVGGTEIGVWNGMGRDGTDGTCDAWVCRSASSQGEYSRCVGWIEMDLLNHGRKGQMSRDGWVRMEVGMGKYRLLKVLTD